MARALTVSSQVDRWKHIAGGGTSIERCRRLNAVIFAPIGPHDCANCGQLTTPNPDRSYPEYCRPCWDRRRHRYPADLAIDLKQYRPDPRPADDPWITNGRLPAVERSEAEWAEIAGLILSLPSV